MYCFELEWELGILPADWKMWRWIHQKKSVFARAQRTPKLETESVKRWIMCTHSLTGGQSLRTELWDAAPAPRKRAGWWHQHVVPREFLVRMQRLHWAFWAKYLKCQDSSFLWVRNMPLKYKHLLGKSSKLEQLPNQGEGVNLQYFNFLPEQNSVFFKGKQYDRLK